MADIKRNRKKHIFEQAALLFRNKGYQASSMRELAECVGLKVSSLYSHIGSKQELLAKICFDSAYLFLSGIESIQASEMDVLSQLEALISLHVDIAVENPATMTVFNDEWKHLDKNGENGLDAFLTLRKSYEHKLSLIFEKGKSQGLIKALDTEIILITFLSSMKWFHSHPKFFAPKNKTLIKQQLSVILLDGVRT